MLRAISVKKQAYLATTYKILYMNETFKARMRRIRIRAGFASQQLAAQAIGCDRRNVGMWEAPSSRVQSVSTDWLFAVARAYRVRPEWINDLNCQLDGYPWSSLPPLTAPIPFAEPTEAQMSLPVCDVRVLGDTESLRPEYHRHQQHYVYASDWLKRWDAQPNELFVMPVNGPAMEPILWNGDHAVVHTGWRTVTDGCVYVVIYGRQVRVKRLFWLADGSLRINSANPDKNHFPDEIVSPQTFDKVHVIGQVIEKIGSGGLGVPAEQATSQPPNSHNR